MKQVAKRTTLQLHKIPLKLVIPVSAVVFVVVSYGLLFFIDKPVQFSYAGATCTPQLTLFPSLHKSPSESDFKIEVHDALRIGETEVVSLRTCFIPQTAPRAGVTKIQSSPFGGWFAKKTFAITIGDAPKASVSALSKPVPTAKPLAIALSATDKVHQYVLAVGEKKVVCEAKDRRTECPIQKLKLEQGKPYTFALYKEFNRRTVATVLSEEVTTLPATNLVKAALTNGQTVYERPTSFEFEFDKVVRRADITLVKIEGDTRTNVSAKSTAKEKKLTITLTKELDRVSNYELTIDKLEADDGSTLVQPHKVAFTVSGGPKVAGVSIGAHSVPANAQIVLTFDQPLHNEVDMAKFIRTVGVLSTVRRLSPNQVTLTLQNAANCSDFTVVVDKGIKSGSNNEVSKEDWKYGSRILCGYSWQIGTSLKGRAIIAHSFGSGASTVLFTGGIHGSEPSSTTTMQAWVNYLKINGNIIPAGKRVVIVPNTNPDAIAVGSRYNARNVNVGRNFPTANWKADIETTNGILVNGGGTSPGSEPEAAALITLTRQLRPRLEVSFHAQGRLVGANKFGDSVAIGDIYATATGYRTMYHDAEAVMGYPMTGEYEDWMGEEMGIAAILIELPTISGDYLGTQLTALRKMLSV